MSVELNPDPEGLHASLSEVEPEISEALYGRLNELGIGNPGERQDIINSVRNEYLDDAKDRATKYMPGKRIAITAAFIAGSAIAASFIARSVRRS